MASPAQVRDRAVVAKRLVDQLSASTALGVPTDDRVDRVSVALRLQTSDLHAALSVLDVARLSFEAAALAVEFLAVPAQGWGELVDVEWPPRPAGQDLEQIPDRLMQLAAADLLIFTVEDIREGSVFVRFTISPMSRSGRKRLLAIVALGSALVQHLLPALREPAKMVGELAAAITLLDDIVSPDDLASVDVATAQRVPGEIVTQAADPPALPPSVHQQAMPVTLDDTVVKFIEAEVARRVAEQVSARLAAMSNPSPSAPPPSSPVTS